MRIIVLFSFIACLMGSALGQSCTISNYEKLRKEGKISQNWLKLGLRVIQEGKFNCPKPSEGIIGSCEEVQRNSLGWKPQIPGGVLAGIFFSESQYYHIKHNFDNPIFLNTLDSIPYPSESIVSDYYQSSHFVEVGTWLSESKKTRNLPYNSPDTIQAKLITVFHGISSWNYCDEEKKGSKGGIVNGEYNLKENTISLYNSSCDGDYMDGLYYWKALPFFKLFMLTAHEYGHAMDDAAGNLEGLLLTKSGRDTAEARATLFAVLITCAFIDLIDMHLQPVREKVQSYRYVLTQEDRNFFRCLDEKLKSMHREINKLKIKQETKINRIYHEKKYSYSINDSFTDIWVIFNPLEPNGRKT